MPVLIIIIQIYKFILPYVKCVGIIFYYIKIQDERGRLMRRTIMRYVCLGLTMVFTNISPRVKKRFPTLDHFVEAGTNYLIFYVFTLNLDYKQLI